MYTYAREECAWALAAWMADAKAGLILNITYIYIEREREIDRDRER